VGNCGTNRHVKADLGDDLRARKPGKANLSQLLVIEHEVVVENRALVETGSIEVEQSLRKEGEVLAVPYVVVVRETECNPKLLLERIIEIE